MALLAVTVIGQAGAEHRYASPPQRSTWSSRCSPGPARGQEQALGPAAARHGGAAGVKEVREGFSLQLPFTRQLHSRARATRAWQRAAEPCKAVLR